MVVLLNKIKNLTSKSKFYDQPIYKQATHICQLPVINKSEVVKFYEDIKCDNQVVFHTITSGSTGTPLKIPWNYTDYICSTIPLWRIRKKYGILSSDFYLTCHVGINLSVSTGNNKIIISQNFLSLSKASCSNDILQSYLSYIKLFAPKWIFAQPSFVYYIGSYMQRYEPDLAASFKYIELVGELLLPDIQNKIKDFFPNAKIVNMYGMQEFSGILYGESDVMELIQDNVYIEILREDCTSCDLGEEGNIVVTGLKNSAFPLVRYNTGDRGKKINIDGKIYYSLTMGKSNDELIYEGKRIDGAIFFLAINMYNETHSHSISKFQAVFQNNKLIFKIFSFDKLPANNQIEDTLRDIIRKIANIHLNVCVEILTDNNCIQDTNKLKYFINKSLYKED